MATHSIILAWKIPWTEEPGGLQSMGPQRVRHDWTQRICQACFALVGHKDCSTLGQLNSYRRWVTGASDLPRKTFSESLGWSKLTWLNCTELLSRCWCSFWPWCLAWLVSWVFNVQPLAWMTQLSSPASPFVPVSPSVNRRCSLFLASDFAFFLPVPSLRLWPTALLTLLGLHALLIICLTWLENCLAGIGEEVTSFHIYPGGHTPRCIKVLMSG